MANRIKELSLSLRSLFVVMLLASLLCATYLVFLEGVVYFDFNSISEIKYPSDEEWAEILDRHKGEIDNGSRNPVFLNECYFGGWVRCFDTFAQGNREWNFETLKATSQHLLSGNMEDTDRIAGNEGWKNASRRIEDYISIHGNAAAINTITKVNPRVYWLVTLVVVMVALVIGTGIRQTNKQ
jgi:hypothetical protein